MNVELTAVAVATTPGPCGCCAPPTPPSAVADCQCASQTGSYCDGITGCQPMPGCPEPPGHDPCQSTYLAPNEIDCPGCGSGLILTNVRAICSNLIVGKTYHVKITCMGFSMPPSFQDININFTASSTSETTSFTALPTPDAGTPVWFVFSVTIEQL